MGYLSQLERVVQLYCGSSVPIREGCPIILRIMGHLACSYIFFTNIFTSSITGALEVWVRVQVQVHTCGVADSVVMATVAVSHWTGVELEVIQRSSGNIRCPLASLWQGSLRGSDKQSTTHIIREDIFSKIL